YVSGTVLPFMGTTLELNVSLASRASVIRRQERLQVRGSTRSHKPLEDQARALVQGWYRDTALTVLSAKTEALTSAMKLRYRDVRVRATRSKWGHCTARGEIQYNWQILLAP